MRARWMMLAFTGIVGVAAAAPISCKGEAGGGGDGGGAYVEPETPYAEGEAYLIPPGITRLGAIAVNRTSGAIYVASGPSILRGDAAGGALGAWKDLTDEGVTDVAALRVLDSGDVAAATASDVVRLSPAGEVLAHARFTLGFGGGFGAPAVAVTPDGETAFAVEGGPGSAGSDGAAVVHVARVDLVAAAASPSPIDPAEVFELTEPFHVVPADVGAINAAAPVVSSDGATLYVAHVVLRTVFAVDVAAPHAVAIVDTDSLQRSSTAASIDGDLLAQVAQFDQTVPIFRVKDRLTARFLAEIPVGESPQAAATHAGRVFVVMSATSFPGFGDGGFPGFGDGGFPGFGDGGFPGFGDGGATTPPALRVFTIAEAQ